MTQTNNRFLDELAKLMTDAAGAAQGMRRDFETMVRSQGERMLREMDVVQREEFEAVKAMAVKAREENEQLAARVAALVRMLDADAGARLPGSRRIALREKAQREGVTVDANLLAQVRALAL